MADLLLSGQVNKALGLMRRADPLIASDMPGFAMVESDLRSSTVIVHALEGFGGERGLVRAMVCRL